MASPSKSNDSENHRKTSSALRWSTSPTVNNNDDALFQKRNVSLLAVRLSFLSANSFYLLNVKALTLVHQVKYIHKLCHEHFFCGPNFFWSQGLGKKKIFSLFFFFFFFSLSVGQAFSIATE